MEHNENQFSVEIHAALPQQAQCRQLSNIMDMSKEQHKCKILGQRYSDQKLGDYYPSLSNQVTDQLHNVVSPSEQLLQYLVLENWQLQ